MWNKTVSKIRSATWLRQKAKLKKYMHKKKRLKLKGIKVKG